MKLEGYMTNHSLCGAERVHNDPKTVDDGLIESVWAYAQTKTCHIGVQLKKPYIAVFWLNAKQLSPQTQVKNRQHVIHRWESRFQQHCLFAAVNTHKRTGPTSRMASVIRLLPCKKIERNTRPYADLLGSIMQKRFLQAFRTVTYLYFIAILFVFTFARSSLTLSRALSLYISISIVLFMFKLVLRSEPLLCPSIFTEVYAKLLSPTSYITLLLHLLSGYFYFKGPLVPKMELYEIRFAEPSKLPEGIPASLALHKTDKWLLLNEKYSYMVTFIILLSIIHSIVFVAGNLNVLELSPHENGRSLIQRLRNRLRYGYKPAFLSWALCLCVCPLIYYTCGRSLVLKAAHFLLFTTSAQSVIELSGFEPSSLLCSVNALLLCLFWYFSYESFMTYEALGPLHRGKTISEFVAADKNGTLVDGLARNPGQLSALTAWFELLVIAEHDANRRKSIYSDVDGEPVIWEQMHRSFQKLIEGHISELAPESKQEKAEPGADQKALRSTAAPTTVTAFLQELKGNNSAEILKSNLTETSNKASSYDVSGALPSIFKQTSAFEKKVSSFSKRLELQSNSRADRARGLLLKFASSLRTSTYSLAARFLATKFGLIFRKTVTRSLNMKIRHHQTTCFALRAMARMITRSLHEDELGYVQSTIAPTLASLDALATLLETMCRNPPVDWTDVSVKSGKAKPDISIASSLASEVTGSFAEILEVFEPYMDNLQVTDLVRSRARRTISLKGIASTEAKKAHDKLVADKVRSNYTNC